MNLFELLDKSVSNVTIRDANDEFNAEFYSNGRKIIFRAIHEVQAREGLWYIDFVEDTDTHKTHRSTGSGGELEVFATIKILIDIFIKKKQPKVINFTAAKDGTSKASLYTRMIKKYKVPGYTAEIKQGRHDVYYTIARDE